LLPHIAITELKTTPQAIPSDDLVDRFCKHIDGIRQDDPDALIMVHCTHGVNRTGYFLVHYLVTRFNISVELALAVFALSRGVALYDAELIEALFEKLGGKNCRMYAKAWYPRFDESESKKLKYDDLIQQRIRDNPSTRYIIKTCQIARTCFGVIRWYVTTNIVTSCININKFINISFVSV
jgi:hypothetical protein